MLQKLPDIIRNKQTTVEDANIICRFIDVHHSEPAAREVEKINVTWPLLIDCRGRGKRDAYFNGVGDIIWDHFKDDFAIYHTLAKTSR